MRQFNLSDYTAFREELRLEAYDDDTGKVVPKGAKAVGTLTNGYGHTGADVFVGQVITPGQAMAWLARDLSIAAREVAQLFGGETWQRLDYVRRIALTDACFALGEPRLAKFVKTIVAVREFHWPTAHAQCLDSLWFKEEPSRCGPAAEMLLTGLPPEGWEVPVSARK